MAQAGKLWKDTRAKVTPISEQTIKLRRQVDGRLIGMRNNRYSWWVHWRDCADYILPRRYRWLITPNMQSRGAPINQHILDSTGTLAARNLAAGLMTGCTDPTKQWFRLRINRTDSTQTSPVSLWLAECERLLRLIFQESNFYTACATLYFDLVVFGTGCMLIYDDFKNVIACYNPCAGEYYLEASKKLHVDVFYREYTFTVSQTVEEFGLENVSEDIARMYLEGAANLTKEIIIAHAIEPNTRAREFGVPEHFEFREVYWQWTGSQSPQGGGYSPGVLRVRGYLEAPFLCPRWDLVSNDPYGRSPGMDALPDIKQLQLEQKRKAQAIDKMVNPPMVADIQLKNQPASLLPGGITYVTGMTSSGKPSFAPVYQVNPPIHDMVEDLNEVRSRIQEIFFNNLFQTIKQLRTETSSNVTATEIDARRAESLVMLGPVLERINYEFLAPAIERTFNIAARAGILPPPPQEIKGAPIDIQFSSMLETAQAASAASGIERIFALLGNLGAIDPAALDNVDIDYGLDKISSLLNNDPKLIRSPDELASIRQRREQEKQQQQAMQTATQGADAAKVLSETDVGGSKNALQSMLGQ